MKTLAALGVLAGLTLLFPQPGSAQPSEELRSLRKELETLKEGQRAILREVQELKSLLRGRQAQASSEPQNVIVMVAGAPFMGEQSAKATLIEFSDYHCPFCARHSRQTLPQLVAEYVKAGKVKYVFRDFPIESIHPQAFKVHEAAHCAGDQGKYWEMHDRLFVNQDPKASPNHLSQNAQALGLDLSSFQQCLDSGKHAARVRKDMAEGQRAGVGGTPTFFLGLTEPSDGKVKALRKLVGAQPYSSFKEALDAVLSLPQP